MTQQHTLRWWEWVSLPALLTGLIYVMGWAYAYAYFAQFHLGLLSLDIQGEYYFIYGFWVLRDHWWLIFAYLAIVALWWSYRRYCRLEPYFITTIVPLLILLLFTAAYQLAHHSATHTFTQQQQSDYAAYPRVKVWLKSTDKESIGLEPTAALLPQGCFRLLLQNQNTAFLFYTNKQTLQAQLAILEIPLGEIRAMRILPQYGSCA